MKAITVHQPWAMLLAFGEKEYETRSWATKYRGPIAIHAGLHSVTLKRFMAKQDWQNAHPDSFFQRLREVVLRHRDPFKASYGDAEFFPQGAIVAVGELVAMHMRYPPDLSEQEAAFGFFGDGRVAWQIANVRRLETPIPARGQQGLWEWTPPDGFVMP